MAAELVISVKTVEIHLTRIYAKLGVTSRSQPAASEQPLRAHGDEARA